MENIKLLLVIILCVSLAACSQTQASIESADSIKIETSTPLYVFNDMKLKAMDEGNILMPVKAVRVLGSRGTVDVQLSKTDLNGGKIGNELKTKYFKYKNLNKYSTLKYKFTSEHLENRYSTYFTNDFYAAIELELYKDEVDEAEFEKVGYAVGNEKSNSTIIIWADYLNGKVKVSEIKDTAKLSEGERVELIDKHLDNTIKEIYEEFYNNDPEEFIKIAREIGETFKSDSVWDKGYGIYNWIIKNIQTEGTNPQSIELDPYNIDPSKAISIKNILATRKTRCSGFATLFDVLAAFHRIESYPIVGVGGVGMLPHMWNAIIDENDKVILVDCTFGIQRANENYIYAPSNEFNSNHYIWSMGKQKHIPYTPFQ